MKEINIELQNKSYNDMVEVKDCCEDAALVSTCCCSMPYGNVHEYDGEHFGLCGRCKEHTDFEREACCE